MDQDMADFLLKWVETDALKWTAIIGEYGGLLLLCLMLITIIIVPMALVVKYLLLFFKEVIGKGD